MIFTPTSWLIPRPTYVPFRKIWDSNFSYLDGFIITSNEFFKLKGKWPLAFTVWKYKPEENRDNLVSVYDLTEMKSAQFSHVNWAMSDEEVNFQLGVDFENEQKVVFGNERKDIRITIPEITVNGKTKQQGRYNFYRNKTKEEEKQTIISGFPLKDDRHQRISAPHGYTDGEFVGFMDDNTPVRLRQESLQRLSNLPDRFWLRLDTDFKGINKSKVFNGPQDNRAYCANSIESAKALSTWFVITKSSNGRYPGWANQLDIWAPEIPSILQETWFAHCFAFVLAENRCVVTKFEANNPVAGAPEVFVDNPLCPVNPAAFWSTTLDSQVNQNHGLAFELVSAIKSLYKLWNKNYCQGQFLFNTGLQDEPYFRYFSYPDFLTPYSGLIQIRKYAEIHNLEDLHEQFAQISAITKKVREELYRMLLEEGKYFG